MPYTALVLFFFFDKKFDLTPQFALIKELFIQALGTPKSHPKSKPFIDHVFSFSILDGKVWFRNYQIAEKDVGKKEKEQTLVEIGPRMVLDPVKILRGSLSGLPLYENNKFINPNMIRSMEYRKKTSKYERRLLSLKSKQVRDENLVLPPDEFEDVFT